MAAPRVQTTRLSVSAVLRDRLLVAATSAAAPQAAAMVSGHGFSGLVVVDAGSRRTVHTLKAAYGSGLLVGQDTEAYLNYVATPAQPMNLPSILGGDPPTLAACMRDQLNGGADFALTPTGQIRDLATLDAAVAAANTVNRSDVVLAAPLPADLMAGAGQAALLAGLTRSRHPIALIVTGQFDPFAKPAVAQTVRALAAANRKVFLHRVDFAAFELLAQGGLGGSIGHNAGLRHTVLGRRPAKTRKKPPDRSPIVLLPEIDSFRHQAVFEPWFRNTRPPICAQVNCCGRNLTTLRDTKADHELANAHSVRAWLPIAEQLITTPAARRRHWLHTYRQQVELAYVELRRRTQVRGIDMDNSQKVWLSLGP